MDPNGDGMSIDPNELRGLPVDQKLEIIDLLWSEINSSSETIPIPSESLAEAQRRRDELRSDPSSGLSHEETWRRIDADG